MIDFGREGWIGKSLLLLLLFSPPVRPASAQEEPPARTVLWHLGFDDDVFGGSDDFFTAGWSLQRHSSAVDSWDGLNLSRPSRWIADFVPGLSGGDGRRVRKGIGLNQIIQTPEDLSRTDLIQDDVPYAGVLGVANSWMVLDNDGLNAFQIYLGMLGPASMAEQVQCFVHSDLGFGEDPMGWDNQLGNEPIVNLNYALARKIAGTGGERKGLGADLSYTGNLGLGNLFTHAQIGLEARLGWRLPEGFAPLPDVIGRGIIMDPVLDGPLPGETRFYFSAVARNSLMAYTALLDGNLFQDSHSVDYDRYVAQILLGAHLEHGAFGIHFTFYFSSNPVRALKTSSPSWGNLSVEYRF